VIYLIFKGGYTLKGRTVEKINKKDKNKSNHLRCLSIGFIIVVILIPVFLGIILRQPFTNINNGSDDGWLGFWGGYFGSIIAIVGVGWTVVEGRKNLDNSLMDQHQEMIRNLDAEKESQFRIARPFFVLRIENHPLYSEEKVHRYVLSENTKLNAESLYDLLEKGKLNNNDLKTIDISNLSKRLMMAVQVNVYYSEDEYIFKIDQINDGETVHLISLEEEQKYSKEQTFDVPNPIAEEINKLSTPEVKQDQTENKKFISKSISSPTKVDIYFTTELREKIKLPFDVDNDEVTYVKEHRILGNKNNESDLKKLDEDYKTDNFKRTLFAESSSSKSIQIR